MVDFEAQDDELNTAIETLENHPEWVPEYDEPVADDGSVTQLDYQHTESGGSLHLVPDTDDDIILFGNLAQYLDSDLPHDPNQEELSGELVQTYNRLAETTESVLIGPMENTYDVLALTVPKGYEAEELEEALTEAGTVSREVERMHDEVIEVVREYRS